MERYLQLSTIRESRRLISRYRSKLIIYTAITGGYDKILFDAYKKIGVIFIAFTDSPLLSFKNWEKIDIKKRVDDRFHAKIYKLYPLLIFGRNINSIWIDGTISFNRQVFDKLYGISLHNYDLALFPHIQRSSVYTESFYCAITGRDKYLTLIKQNLTYWMHGVKYKSGLWCGFFIIRNHKSYKTRIAMDLWNRHIVKYSIRDQVSLVYIIFKLKLNVLKLHDDWNKYGINFGKHNITDFNNKSLNYRYRTFTLLRNKILEIKNKLSFKCGAKKN